MMSTPEPFPAAYYPPVEDNEDIKEESSSEEFSSKVFPPGAFPPENCLPADREPINVDLPPEHFSISLIY